MGNDSDVNGHSKVWDSGSASSHCSDGGWHVPLHTTWETPPQPRTAVLCPVCKGAGQVIVRSPAYPSLTRTAPQMKTCHGCHGKGWVTP